MKNKEIINRLGNGTEITARGEWFVVVDTDFENGFVWGVDQDGGEQEEDHNEGAGGHRPDRDQRDDRPQVRDDINTTSCAPTAQLAAACMHAQDRVICLSAMTTMESCKNNKSLTYYW